ncbi:hypothetical protein QFC21_000954 [Naganishia friedmannii]|uniref:Uncharacterized protein n=1 Tax=Naganishia friedmannii TaxID=89922 RepID=A0ACC2W6X6_9TREE|nr:hypothetical protein QFC21_000954 [Naganishia friedmannii]
MAAIIIGILHVLQKVLCGGGGNVDGKPNQGGQPDYYNNQQQHQQNQGFPPLQANQYPPQQGIGHQQHQNAWNGQNHGNNHGYQPQQQHGSHAPYKASHQANIQRPNYNGPGSVMGGSIIGPHHKQDPNMVNQSNAHYTSLRNQAREHGTKAHQYFEQSQRAYQAGDGARAHELSEMGKAETRKKDQVDDEAEEWIYRAIDRTEAAIAQAQRAGQQGEIRLIVGKGIHSAGHQAKIKPAIVELMQKYHLSARIDPQNAGVLVVDLSGREEAGRSRDVDTVMSDMSGKLGGDCTIM